MKIMAKGSCCVVCGKKQRIIPVNTVKYATQNTLPEVLSSAIGNKITCESWNDGNKHICYRCNRQCEEFDKINTRLEDLRDHLLQEYTRRMLEESKADTEVPSKRIDTQMQNCIEGGVISDEEGETGKDDATADSKEGERDKDIQTKGENAVEVQKGAETARESEKKGETNQENYLEREVAKVTEIENGNKDGKKNNAGEKEKAKDSNEVGDAAGQSMKESDGKEKNRDGGCEKEGEVSKENTEKGNRRGKRQGDEEHNEVPAEEVIDATNVMVTIKTEELDEEATLEDPEWHSENLPDHVDDDTSKDNSPKKQVIRLTEKTNLRRLPDYEYRQWYTLDDYSYILHTKNNRGELLKCHKSGCAVSARVTQAALVKITGEHCHEPDRRIVERNELYARLKERCMTDATTPLRTIYEEEAEKFPGGANCLPFPEVRMREWRAANDPTVVVHTDASVLDETAKRFQCEVCNMGFNSSRLLIRHADKHNQSKTTGRKKLSGAKAFTVSSPITAEKQKLKNKLDKTLQRVVRSLKHQDEESANDTENEAPGEKCQTCQKEFGTLEEVKAHILEEHREVMMCVHCDIVFDTPFIMMRHQTSCVRCRDARLQEHREETSRAERKQESAAAEGAPDDEMMHELSRITGQEAAEDISQDENDPTWDPTQGDESAADDGDPDFRVPRKKRSSEPPKIQQCEVCEKTFPNQQQLTTHLYTHSSTKKYGCPCGETFNKKAVLTRHMLAKNHRGSINIHPPVVDSTIWKVTEGIRCIWDGTKFECAVCAATFNRKQLLLQHMRDEKHITDQIIIHDAQPQSHVNVPKKKVKKENPVYVPRSQNRMLDTLPKINGPDGPIAVGGLRFSNRSDAVQAWYELSGKKPFECAVCGEGFMSRIRLLAHMENLNHLSDSIVENVPELKDLMYAENNCKNNHIVPSDTKHKVKQESGINIISQVIMAPMENSQHEDYILNTKEEIIEKDQTYYLQTENVDGETVMVIQGDLDASIHENMQLYMDEEGNIVTQDEDGNTVKVMQVDLSKMQEKQSEQEVENNSQEMEDDSQEMEYHSQEMEHGIQEMRDDSQEMEHGIQEMRDDSQEMEHGIQEMRDDSQEMKDEAQEIEDDVEELEDASQEGEGDSEGEYIQIHNVGPGAGLYVDGTGQADAENDDSENTQEYTEVRRLEEAQEMMEDQEDVESEDRIEQTEEESKNYIGEDQENIKIEETQGMIDGNQVITDETTVKEEQNLKTIVSRAGRIEMQTVGQILPEKVRQTATVESPRMKTRNLEKIEKAKQDASIISRLRKTRFMKL